MNEKELARANRGVFVEKTPRAKVTTLIGDGGGGVITITLDSKKKQASRRINTNNLLLDSVASVC